MRGGQEDDVLSGGGGADFMSGDRSNDTLTGGAGGAGADTVITIAGGATMTLVGVTYANLSDGWISVA